MRRRQQPWFIGPIVLLTLGVVLAGFVLFKLVTRGERSINNNTNRSVNSATVEHPTCGNGICENVSCTSTNCPAPESATTCPEDCSVDAVGGSDESPADTNTANDNVNSSGSKTLNFTFIAQTKAESTDCPVNTANMTASDAVGAAAAIGLEQGTKNVSVSFALSEKPLEECVWTIKNYLTPTSGKIIVVIDSTQDILRTTTWKE